MTTLTSSPRLRGKRRNMQIRILACVPALTLVAFVLMAPVGWLSWLSVRDSNGFTFRNYSRMLVNSGYASSLETTLEVAALVTVLSTVLAYPVALLLARLRGWQARLVLAIVLLPLWTSLLVRTFAWLVLLQRHGLINSTLLTLGIIDAPLALVNNLTGTVIGMTHVMTPFVVLPVTAVAAGPRPRVVPGRAEPWRGPLARILGSGVSLVPERRDLGRYVGVRDVAWLLRHAEFSWWW